MTDQDREAQMQEPTSDGTESAEPTVTTGHDHVAGSEITDGRGGAGGATVYLVTHDDRFYDMGDTYVRSVHATNEGAAAAIVERTSSGRRTRAEGGHDEHCCEVVEREVEP